MSLSAEEHKAYLQRYLSKPANEEEKPKKRRKKSKPSDHVGMRIIDDDVDFGSIKYGEAELFDEDKEDAPQLADEAEAAGRTAAQLDSVPTTRQPRTSSWVPVDRQSARDTCGRDRSRARHDSPDPSPARRGGVRVRHDSPDPSPLRRGGQERHTESGPSPPKLGWSRARHDSPDVSPPRRGGSHARHDSPDSSPRRRRGGQARQVSPDISPPRCVQDSHDPSPPRRGSGHARSNSPDPSPPHRKEGAIRHNYSDRSPQHWSRGQTAHTSPDRSPSRQGKGTRGSPDQRPNRGSRGRPRHDSPDPSPPRRSGGHVRHDSPDPSPPRRDRRRVRHDSPDASPPRRGSRHASNESPDQSPSRRKSGSDVRRDLSEHNGAGGSRRGYDQKHSLHASFSAPGLHTDVGRDVAELRAQQSQQFSHEDALELGAGADTVRRDKHGRKLEMLSELQRQQESGMRTTAPAPVWGSGLIQQRNKKEQMEHNRAWGARPLAQYEDNAERDLAKRGVQRWGDPMAGRLTKMSASSNKPKYSGPPAPPNRFNIMPGHEWDGVDRSNGYEKQFFIAQATARARADQAHAWAVEDM